MQCNKPGSSKWIEDSPKRSEGSPKRSEGSPRWSERSPKSSEGSPKRSEGSPKRSEGSSKRLQMTASSMESKPRSTDVSKKPLIADDESSSSFSLRERHQVFHTSGPTYGGGKVSEKGKSPKQDEHHHTRTKEHSPLEENPESKVRTAAAKARDSHAYHVSNLRKKPARFVPSNEDPNESEQTLIEENRVLNDGAQARRSRDSHAYHLSHLRKKHARFVPSNGDLNESEQNLFEETPETSETSVLNDEATTSKARDSHPYHLTNFRKKKAHFALDNIDPTEYKTKAKPTEMLKEVRFKPTEMLKEVRFENVEEQVPEKKQKDANIPKEGGSQSKSNTATPEKVLSGGKPKSASVVPKSAGGKTKSASSTPVSATGKPMSAKDSTGLEGRKASSSRPSAPAPHRSAPSTSTAGQHEGWTTPSNYHTTFETWQPGKQKVKCPRCNHTMIPLFRRSKNTADRIFKPSCLLSCWPCVLLPFVNNSSGLGQIRMYCSVCKSLIGVFNPDKDVFENPRDFHHH